MPSLCLLLPAFVALGRQTPFQFRSTIVLSRGDYIVQAHVGNILRRIDLEYNMGASAFLYLRTNRTAEYVENALRTHSPETIYKFIIKRDGDNVSVGSLSTETRLAWPIRKYSKRENAVIPYDEIFKRAASYLKVKERPTKLEYIPSMIAGADGGAELAYEIFVGYGARSVRFYYLNRKLTNMTAWANPA